MIITATTNANENRMIRTNNPKGEEFAQEFRCVFMKSCHIKFFQRRMFVLTMYIEKTAGVEKARIFLTSGHNLILEKRITYRIAVET